MEEKKKKRKTGNHVFWTRMLLLRCTAVFVQHAHGHDRRVLLAQPKHRFILIYLNSMRATVSVREMYVDVLLYCVCVSVLHQLLVAQFLLYGISIHLGFACVML